MSHSRAGRCQSRFLRSSSRLATAITASRQARRMWRFPLSPETQVPLKRTHHHGSSGKIQHVVIIIQENRSFNNLLYGFPGATTTTYGYNLSGKKITLQPVVLETTWDILHTSFGFVKACNGTGSIPGTNCRMNGFDKETWTCGGGGNLSVQLQIRRTAYVPHSETKPYFDMGKQYVVADQMYASNFDASSFTSHQYIIAAQAEKSVNYPLATPWGCPGRFGRTDSDRRSAAPSTVRL